MSVKKDVQQEQIVALKYMLLCYVVMLQYMSESQSPLQKWTCIAKGIPSGWRVSQTPQVHV